MAISKRQAKRAARRYWPLGLAILALAIGVLAWIVAPAAEWIGYLTDAVGNIGAYGPVVFFIFYMLGTLVLAPSPVMSIAAGAAFGWWGLPLVVIAGTAGATLAFLISRYFFTGELEDWLTDRPSFRAAKHAVDDEGWRILLLLRVSPVVPFGPQNYLLGLTRVPLKTYVLCTAVGITPGNVVDIYLGVVGVAAAKGATVAQYAYLGVGLLATIAIVLLVTVKARAYLREAGVKV